MDQYRQVGGCVLPSMAWFGLACMAPDGAFGAHAACPAPHRVCPSSHLLRTQQAARNAIEAGFDGVEIHGANGEWVGELVGWWVGQCSTVFICCVHVHCRPVLFGGPSSMSIGATLRLL